MEDGRLTTRISQEFNASTFQLFLQQLLRHRRSGRKLFVVLDNASWHHARALRPWLRDHRRILQLDFLSPYSPELNSVERVWKLTRRLCTHNRYFPVLEELVQTVCNQFARWQSPNATLQRLCAVI